MFHLVFLRALVAKGENKSLIALKGGCNLRFYFGSVRYSEDMDLDVVVVARDTLKNKVDRLLKSPLVTSPLKTKGITSRSVGSEADRDDATLEIGLSVRGLDCRSGRRSSSPGATRFAVTASKA